jgi:hypothetical protein
MRRQSVQTLTPLVAALALLGAPAAVRPADTWRYVVPAPGDPHEHPPLRALALSTEKPKDLKETAHYRGRAQHYGQLTYGSAASAPVAVVIDEVSADEADLYVDAARSRTVAAGDRAARTGGAWRVKLDAVVRGENATSAVRTVVFRLGRSGRTLSFATCGYLEGKVRLGGRDVAARRQDGDGNGLFTDPQDRLWLDLNGDGRWDPLDEQFLFVPILSLRGDRFALHSDLLGRRLTLEKVEGTGTVRLSVRPPELAARVEELTVTLAGRDGSVYTLRGRDSEAVLPVGDYRLSVVTCRLADPHSGPAWSFTFSDSNGRRPHCWHTLRRDARLALDPIGKLELLAAVDPEQQRCRPGDSVSVQPGLYTGDGLLICSASRGTGGESHDCGGEVLLAGTDGKVLDAHGSGFA